MRNRDIPAAVFNRLNAVLDLPTDFIYVYLGRCLKSHAGSIDLPTGDSNKYRRVELAEVTLKGRTGKRHRYHLGWLLKEQGGNTVYWGLGR